MEERKALHCDIIQYVKKRLLDYREREREIDIQIERIENFDMKMTSLQSPELSGMPHAKFSTQDRIGKMLARKDEMKRNVISLIEYQETERLWIREMLCHVRKADERACIEMRYLDSESWPKVAMLLFGKMDDYEEKRDSYLRRTTNLHSRALVQMAEWIEANKQV